jgi:peptidoglycan L-alanyl-D-glutamate endopeptidase CwlK
MKKLSRRSLQNIDFIEPELAIVIGMVLARGNVDFTVISGFRTAEEQNKMFAKGVSKLDGYENKSYHQSGMAIDFIPYPFNGWDDKESFRKVWDELAYCARYLGFKHGKHIDWDGGHFEIRGVI